MNSATAIEPDWPRITVVTPSFNQARYLRTTIESVLSQQYPNLEYIIVDGGSTDGSDRIIREYEPWLTHWVSEPDGGQSQAINKGWARSTGELWTWLNSDDVLRPGTLFEIASAFRQDPDIILAYGDFEEMNAHGAHIRVTRPGVVTYSDMLQGNRIGQPGTFLRRSAIEGQDVVAPGLRYCMDYALWLRVFPRGKVTYLPRVLAGFRLHPASKTVTAAGAMAAELAAVLHAAECPPEMRAARAMAVARWYCRASALVWCAGDYSEAARLMAEAECLAPEGTHDPGFADCLSRQAVAIHGDSAGAIVHQFFEYIEQSHPTFARVLVQSQRRAAVGWTNVLIARSQYPRGHWPIHAWRAVRHGTSRQVLQLAIDPMLRAIVGRQALSRLQRARGR